MRAGRYSSPDCDTDPAARAERQCTMAGSFPMFWLSPARLRGL